MPAAKRFEPTDEQLEELRTAYHSSPDRYVRERALALIMTAQGHQRQQVAAALDISTRSVTRYIDLFNEGGVEALSPNWGGGWTPLIPEELTETILDWVKQGPQACGLDRANWTYEELARHLLTTHGIEVSTSTMRNWCHDHDVRPYRPTYRFLRANEEKKAAARQELSALKRRS